MTYQLFDTRAVLRAMLALSLSLLYAPSVGAQVPRAGAPPGPALVANGTEIACAPRLAAAYPSSPIQIVGSQDGPMKVAYGPGDALIINGGLDQGVQIGQEYFVRRIRTPYYQAPNESGVPRLLHTAGWIRVVAVEQATAVATVVHACDGFLQDDYLEPFSLPQPPQPAPVGEADYADTGSVLFGQDGGDVVGLLEFMVIDRGSDHGIAPGQRLTVFRETLGPVGPVTEVGEAIVVLVAPETATARLVKMRDAVYSGDLIALQR